MASFTEYVHLIAEGQEAIALINKINQAIAKMRREAASPINVKVQSEFEKVAAGERKVRGERKSSDDAELAALKKKRAELAAIVAMNKEQGNPSYAIRFGNQESLAQSQRFNEQLAESTRRINRMADAHKHIKNVAKEADVEVSKSLAEKLAAQVATRSEKSDAQAIREAALAERARISAVNERIRQEEEGVKRVAKIESERAKTINERTRQEEEGVKRINQMEGERVRTINDRLRQEEEGHKRVAQIEGQRRRDEERAQREERNVIRDRERAEQRARRERETQIASAREGGIRGVAGELQRDVRRNLIYGAIGQGEALLHKGYEADVARDTATENLRQAGRTAAEIKIMSDNALKLSLQNPTVNATEMLTMQQHNVGAFGDFGKGMANNELSARYLAARKGKVGEDKALNENLTFLKIGEETGHIRDGAFMKKLYDTQLKIAQAEGAQYNPESMLTMVRQLKSSKYGMSDETLLNILPFAGIGEGASRLGNQVAMLQRSMGFVGKSLSKDNQATIAGTALSNGYGGYNKEIFQDVASGRIDKLADIMDKFFTQKGFDPNDKSRENINNMMTTLGKAIGNTSAREVVTLLTENRDQIKKQQDNAAKSQGLATPQQAMRTLQGAQDAAVSQFENMSANVLKPLNPVMIRMMNGITVLEEYAAKSGGPSGAAVSGAALGSGLGIAGLIAVMKGAYANPQMAVQTGLLTTIAANTGVSAAASIGNVSKDAAKLFGVNPLLLGALAGVAVQQGVIQPWIDAKRNEAQEANVNQYRSDFKLLEKALDQLPKRIANHDYNSGDRDDHRSTKEEVENQLRIALEAKRRNDRDDKNSIYYSPTSSFPGRKAPGSSEPIIVATPQVIVKDQPFHKEWHLGPSDTQGMFNSGGIVNNAAGTAKDIATSTAKDALAKLNAAGTDAAGEIETAAHSAGGAIKSSGGIISSAIEAVASAMQGAASRLGSIGGTPVVKPQATGAADPGAR